MADLVVSHLDRFQWMENILADAGLTPTQKNILVRLALHQNMKTGRLDPSVRGLAAGTATRDRAVQLTLARAERDGLIDREIGGGRDRSSYRLLLKSPPISSVEGEIISEPVHGETLVYGETLVHGETPVHTKTGTGARPRIEGCTVVHPNSENRKKNSEEMSHCRTVASRCDGCATPRKGVAAGRQLAYIARQSAISAWCKSKRVKKKRREISTKLSLLHAVMRKILNDLRFDFLCRRDVGIATGYVALL
jgi:hypothetical protein